MTRHRKRIRPGSNLLKETRMRHLAWDVICMSEGAIDRLGPPWCGLQTVSLALSSIVGEPRAHGSA